MDNYYNVSIHQSLDLLINANALASKNIQTIGFSTRGYPEDIEYFKYYAHKFNLTHAETLRLSMQVLDRQTTIESNLSMKEFVVDEVIYGDDTLASIRKFKFKGNLIFNTQNINLNRQYYFNPKDGNNCDRLFLDLNGPDVKSNQHITIFKTESSNYIHVTESTCQAFVNPDNKLDAVLHVDRRVSVFQNVEDLLKYSIQLLYPFEYNYLRSLLTTNIQIID